MSIEQINFFVVYCICVHVMYELCIIKTQGKCNGRYIHVHLYAFTRTYAYTICTSDHGIMVSLVLGSGDAVCEGTVWTGS